VLTPPPPLPPSLPRSLASSRSSSSRGGEPGDAVRVVNSVLTSLDTLRRRTNVLVLCTTNMVTGIDKAFLDRADIKIQLPAPGSLARLLILRSCIEELQRAGLLCDQVGDSDDGDGGVEGEVKMEVVEKVAPVDSVDSDGTSSGSGSCGSVSDSVSGTDVSSDGDEGDGSVLHLRAGGISASAALPAPAPAPAPAAASTAKALLRAVVQRSEGMSGRALRKLPMRAHVEHRYVDVYV